VAQVVLLRGVNIGGHRTFRPTRLARQLKHLDAVNIGAAGTFVIRHPITQTQLRAEVVRRLPFDAEVIICTGRKIAMLLSQDYFANQRERPDVVRFVTVLSRSPRATLPAPMTLPPSGRWLVKILAREDRFIIGVHRREMKAIGHLDKLHRRFGVPVTTRSWNTIAAIGRVLAETGN